MNSSCIGTTAPWVWFKSLQDMPALVAPGDAWTLWAIILAGVAASIYLEQTYRWAAKMSGPVLALVAAMVLSNLKITPTASPTYDVVHDYLVPIAIPLLLMRADVRRIVRTSGTMFAAFHLSALGTLLGALLAAWLFRGVFEHLAEVTGIMTASYTGGGVNFFAVKGSFQVSEDLTNPLLVADNFIMAGIFGLLLVLAGTRLLLRLYPHPHSLETNTENGRSLAAEHWRPKQISLLDIAKCLAFAVVVSAVSHKLAAAIAATSLPPLARAVVGNQYVLITLLSVTAATLLHRRIEKIGGSEELGAYLLYTFFFVIGLPADLVAVMTKVPMMFVFCLVIALVNLTVTLLLGKLLRLNLEELLVCVNATLGGPPSAAAMAITKGWSKLVLPALLVGIWGYVIGTFLGVLVGETLRLWMTGGGT
ncbi:MAG: DUF819 domain-containing protein [Pirellulales bacterium]|nr:DUF819 domain-containing protein [Pirellulales bacterium]